MVTVTAPCRADLAGGTLDIWPLGVLHPGALTVNVALPFHVELELTEEATSGTVAHRTDGGTRTLSAADSLTDLTAAVCYSLHPTGGLGVTVRQQAPMGSGLGGSSSYAVALASAILALQGRTVDATRMVWLLRDLEARVLGAPTGTQDHWAAVYGGTLALHLEPGGDEVEQLAVSPAWLAERLSVFFTGITHHSGMVNWQVIRRRMEADPTTSAALTEIAAAARDARSAVTGGDDPGVAEAIRREWAARRLLAPEVCPPELATLEEVAKAAGADAFKACGAGGGGSILVWHRPERAEGVLEALQKAAPKGRCLARGCADHGVVVDGGFATLTP